GVAEITYDHPGQVATSVVDFVALDVGLFGKVGDIEYLDLREKLETDHMLLSLKVPLFVQERKVVERRKKVKKSDMVRLKTIPVKDPFWKTLPSFCSKHLEGFRMGGDGIDVDYEKFCTVLKAACSDALRC